jgi:hypothetical protein
MADQASRKGPFIPEWQQKFPQTPRQTDDSNDHDAASNETSSTAAAATEASDATELPLVEQARKFLEEDSIRDASRARKVAFLEKKGLNSEQIEQLLGSEQPSTSASDSELKTVHDTTETSREDTNTTSSTPPSEPARSDTVTSPSLSKRDIPPIITYPEFLLKPQKPPPLVTFERLARAAYAFAGVSALTYAASTYIVQPMLESLTEARHELAAGAEGNLETLNEKLESVVSHVPYIASSSVLLRQRKQQEFDDDLESTVSDPTELFHRDIATQTSPPGSRPRSPSTTHDLHNLESTLAPSLAQTSRLESLNSSLSELLVSTDQTPSRDRLKDQVGDFQSMLDKMQMSHNPLDTAYDKTFTSYSATKTPAGDSEIAKIKADVRALKGIFLSSRNFPTTRPGLLSSSREKASVGS